MWKTLGLATERRSPSNGHNSPNGLGGITILPQATFARMVRLERKRSERSKRRFVLMLLDASKLLKHRPNDEAFERILAALSLATRETDIQGWYTAHSVLGVIFTEIGPAGGAYVTEALSNRVTKALRNTLDSEHIGDVSLSFHVYPDDDRTGSDQPDSRLYPDMQQEMAVRAGSYVIKRFIDIVGSLMALQVAFPLLLVVALAIKVTSPGPVFFRQTRVGQFGRTFMFFKFRSMYVGTDSVAHQNYMRQLIGGTAVSEPRSGSDRIYKLTGDRRITRIGGFLRRTSLDEIPQFLNVLRGEMSLVGPRPPIPYEVESYDFWHKSRLLAVKPGITGLWQVGGRNKLKFDEMVRLDLQYAASWSVRLDLKILFKTPRAVLDGA